MIYFHVWQDPVLLEYPINLFLLTPNHIPVIVPSLSPLSISESIVNTVFECGFKLNIVATSFKKYGGLG